MSVKTLNNTTRAWISPRKDEAYVMGLLDGWIVVYRGQDYRQPSEDIARAVCDVLNTLGAPCDGDHEDLEEEAHSRGYDEGVDEGLQEAVDWLEANGYQDAYLAIQGALGS